MSAPSIVIAEIGLEQTAMAADRFRQIFAKAYFPSLRDAGTIARINTARAEIEGQSLEKPVPAGD
jgi:hypothetical protein